jgi:molybdopterin-guanine dinucleotide biosynthesis protein A
MTTFSEKFDGYVLAGGKSSRMKTDKAFLEFKGVTFLTRAVKTVSSVCENRVKIVLNKTQTNFIERLPDRIPHIFDVYENRGALGGIHAALNDCRSEWAIVLAVDLPLVKIETIEILARIALDSNNLPAVVPIQKDGRPQPLCAVYRAKDCLAKLDNLLNKTVSASVKDFLKLVPFRLTEQNELTAGEGENIFYNVNEPSEYQLMLRSIV